MGTITICLFTVLAMGLSLYSVHAMRRAVRLLNQERKRHTTHRVAFEMRMFRNERESADEIARQVRACQSHAVVATEAAVKAQNAVRMVDEMLGAEADTDPMINAPASGKIVKMFPEAT